MKQKEVKINGKTYPVVFTMKTITGFEEIVNHSFFNDGFDKMTSRMAIVVAAILAADENAEINAESLLNAESWAVAKDIIEAYTTVMDMANDFFAIPEGAKGNAKADNETEDGEKPKN